MSTTFPIIMTAAGPQPTPPATLNAAIIDEATVLAPGLTANLPGSLIEDMSSTATGAAVQLDQARVDLVNSLTPYGANEFVLYELGPLLGITPGLSSNTSVYVVISGNVGFIINPGFIVTDGTYPYVVQDGGIVTSTGSTAPLYCIATQSGTWAVPVGTVTTISTSLPSGIALTVTNPSAGTPGGAAETAESYRARVLQAYAAPATGTPSYLKSLIQQVAGVQSRLVAVQQGTGGWEVIVGGGDPYAVAYAIYRGMFDLTLLVGSTMAVTAITRANPGVVTTLLNHGYATGQVVVVNGIVGMTALNGVPLTITVLTETTFSIGVDTTGYAAYVSGGVVTPNLRNTTVPITDYPDTYSVTFVTPPQQAVTMTVTWNTTLSGFLQQATVAALGSAALIAYVNALPVGTPMNEFEMQAVFQTAVTSVLPPQYLTRLVFAVSINGIGTAPSTGTGIISGDPESYFECSATAITVVQG